MEVKITFHKVFESFSSLDSHNLARLQVLLHVENLRPADYCTPTYLPSNYWISCILLSSLVVGVYNKTKVGIYAHHH